MSEPLKELLALLDLEPLEVNIYRGQNKDLGTGRVFGGQVFAQALVAAHRTVDDTREAHSAHGYFILPGDLAAPIVYFVDRLRDGTSFTTRRVTGIQHGQAIFNLSASFHVSEKGPEHQSEMPDVPDPESLTADRELVRAIADRIPEPLRSVLTREQPIDIRQIDPINPLRAEKRPPVRRAWFRTVAPLSDESWIHQALLAYASDYRLLLTALQPHGIPYGSPGLQLASLDHSLWIHRPFRADEWLLYSTDSPITWGARGFVRGTIHTRSGELVASVAQEGLIRVRKAADA